MKIKTVNHGRGWEYELLADDGRRWVSHMRYASEAEARAAAERRVGA